MISTGDFETTLESTSRGSLASSAIPIIMNEPAHHVGTLNATHRHHNHHHSNHHHHQHGDQPSNHHHHHQHSQARRHPVTLHLNTSNGSYPSELATLLRHIVEHSGSRRADVLRDLRHLLKKSGGHLPDVDRMQFFEAFYPMLIDARWKVVCECTMLIVDIIPQMGEHDLDPCMAIILPRIVPNLGHEATDVRRASLRLLHVYMRYTNNLQKVLRLYIQYGLESHDKSAQKGCVLSLPLLFTEEFSKENLFPLVQSLGHLLVHSDASLFYPIFLAMQRLHALVGNETFRLYLQHLSTETVSLYQKVLSRASTADSDGRNNNHNNNSNNQDISTSNNMNDEPTNQLMIDHPMTNEDANHNDHDKHHENNQPAIPIEKIITTNELPKPFDEPFSSPDDESINRTESKLNREDDRGHRGVCNEVSDFNHETRNQLATGDSNESTSSECNSSDSKTAFANEYVLIYGIFPVAVHNRASSTKMADKLEGLGQMMSIIKEAPDSHVAGLLPYLPSFLDNFINCLVNNPNFKVTLMGLDMIEMIIGRLGVSAYPCLETVIDILLKRLGDGRSIVREHDIKVIHRLMLHWPPQNVLDILLRHKFHRNPKVREEIINRVTFALLMFPRTEFNLHRITYEISTMLIDPKRQVRLSALESMAVIAQALGPARLDSLFSTVAAIEQTSESDGLVNAVQARLARRDLPRCNPDGSLRYVLNVSNFSGWFPSTSEADIEWVLLASSSHIGTSPKPGPHFYLGRFNEQYRRYTLRQAELEGFNFLRDSKRLDESETESGCNGSTEEMASEPAENNQIYQTKNGTEDEDGQHLSPCVHSDDKSQQSDETTKTISSRSKTADWAKKVDTEFDTKSSRRSSFSQLTDYNSHHHHQHHPNHHLHHSYQDLHSHSSSSKQHLISQDPSQAGPSLVDLNADAESESQLSQSYNESIHHNDHIVSGGLSVGPRDTRAYSMPVIPNSGLVSESSQVDLHSNHENHIIEYHNHHQPSHCYGRINGSNQEVFDHPIHHRKSVTISPYPRSVPTSPEKRNSFQTSESDFDITFEVRPRSASKSSLICPVQPTEESTVTNSTSVNANVNANTSKSKLPTGTGQQAGSTLNISKGQELGSRRGSTILTPNKDNNERLPTDDNRPQDDHQNQETSEVNNQQQQRSSILPSVSVDEPTESDDDDDGHQSEENKQMTNSSLPVDEVGQHDDDDQGHCEANNETDKKMDNQRESVKLNETKSGDQNFGASETVAKDATAAADDDDNGGNTDDNDGDDGAKNDCEVSSRGSKKEETIDEEDESVNDTDHDHGHDDEDLTVAQQQLSPEESKVLPADGKPKSKTPGMKRKPIIQARKRTSRSSSPVYRQPQYHMIRIQPAIPPNANIRHIMENVVKTEGPFDHPQEALRAALAAFGEDAWTTKVEGMLAVTRLASFHPSVLQKDFHSIIVSLVDEVKNLRSSVSRSAIFTLGDLFVKMKRSIEPEIELIGTALLAKCSENASFIREDCERTLMSMVEEMPQIKSALVLIHSGANHRNMNVRRIAAFFLSILVEKMGPVKCLMGPKDIGEHLLQSAAKFLQDGSPHTRYYGRKIFSVLMNHNLFDKLLRKHVTPGTYRNICGILDSIKRRGVGEKPADLTTPIKP